MLYFPSKWKFGSIINYLPTFPEAQLKSLHILRWNNTPFINQKGKNRSIADLSILILPKHVKHYRWFIRLTFPTTYRLTYFKVFSKTLCERKVGKEKVFDGFDIDAPKWAWVRETATVTLSGYFTAVWPKCTCFCWLGLFQLGHKGKSGKH